jgi:hypothetical protein
MSEQDGPPILDLVRMDLISRGQIRNTFMVSKVLNNYFGLEAAVIDSPGFHPDWSPSCFFSISARHLSEAGFIFSLSSFLYFPSSNGQLFPGRNFLKDLPLCTAVLFCPKESAIPLDISSKVCLRIRKVVLRQQASSFTLLYLCFREKKAKMEESNHVEDLRGRHGTRAHNR